MQLILTCIIIIIIIIIIDKSEVYSQTKNFDTWSDRPKKKKKRFCLTLYLLCCLV